jgi:hypothetical protein
MYRCRCIGPPIGLGYSSRTAPCHSLIGTWSPAKGGRHTALPPLTCSSDRLHTLCLRIAGVAAGQSKRHPRSNHSPASVRFFAMLVGTEDASQRPSLPVFGSNSIRMNGHGGPSKLDAGARTADFKWADASAETLSTIPSKERDCPHTLDNMQ